MNKLIKLYLLKNIEISFCLIKSIQKNCMPFLNIEMLRVSQYLEQITKLFQHNDSQIFKIIVPHQGGYVSTIFEQQNNTICAEILSSYQFEKGTLITKAYSDDACKVIFSSRNIIHPVKTAASLIFADPYPVTLKVSYARPIGRHTFKQSSLVTTHLPSKNPSQLVDSNIPNFMLHTSTQLFNPIYSFRFEVFSGANILLFESFLKKFCIIGLSLAYSWQESRLVDAQLVSGFSIKEANFGFSSSFIGRSVKCSAVYKIDQKTNVGALFGFENIGHETDTVVLLAASQKLKDNSKAKIIFNSSKIISASYKVRFQDFMKMKFTGSLDYSANDHFQSHFGANIVFDLAKRSK